MVKKVAYVFYIILSLLLVGGTLFVTANFDVSIFSTPDFWYQVMGSNVANILLLTSTAKLDIDKEENTNPDIKKRKDDITSVVQSTVKDDFNDFIAEENKKRKVEEWKDIINNKIAKLDKFATSKSNDIYQNGTEEQKKKSRYCRKRKKLQEKLSTKFIDENIVYLRVKYIKLKRYEITNDSKQRHTNYELTTNKSKRILRDIYPRFVFIFSITLFASTFSNLMLKEFTISTLIVFAMKLISLFMSIFNGKEHAKEFVSTTLIGDLQFRRDILTKYMTWKLKKNENKGLVVINNGSN